MLGPVLHTADRVVHNARFPRLFLGNTETKPIIIQMIDLIKSSIIVLKKRKYRSHENRRDMQAQSSLERPDGFPETVALNLRPRG